MIYLVEDPGQKYIPRGIYKYFNPKDIPNTSNKTSSIRSLLLQRSITDTRKIIFYNIHKLNNKQSIILSNLLLDKFDTNKVIMTCNDLKNVSDHIMLIPSIKTKKIRSNVKAEKTFYNKLMSYIKTRDIPENELLMPFIKSLSATPTITKHNIELASQVDKYLFKTNTDYVKYMWAGLHKNETKTFLKFRKKIKVEEKVKQIISIVKGTRKAKKENKVKARRSSMASNF